MNDTADSTAQSKKSGARAGYSSPAVDKAVDIIEFLASIEESVSITAIADGLNRTVGEIYRVVLALERRSIVSRDQSTDRFRLSLRLFDLANRFPPVERLVQAARPEMDALSKRTNQSCHLAVAEGTLITIVTMRESPLPMRYSVRMGSSFDMFETSSGVIIAAFSPQEQRNKWLAAEKPAARALLEQRFESVRENGYEIRPSATVSGLDNISVPIHSQQGKILAALTVPYLAQSNAKLDPQAVLDLLLKTSARMMKLLG